MTAIISRRNMAIAALISFIVVAFFASKASSNGTELIFYPTDDCHIQMNYPDNNNGSSYIMSVRNRYGHISHPDYWEIDPLIRFDLSSIPPECDVASASLHLYYYDYAMNDPVGRDLAVYRVTSGWDESTVTWNTQPDTDSNTTSSSIVPGDTLQWITWDVTSDVQAYVGEQATNYGWMIKDTTTWRKYDIPRAMFHTKEYGSYIPYLTVEMKGLLTFPSVTVGDCGDCYYDDTLVQPVVIELTEPVYSGVIPIEVPEGMEIYDVTPAGWIEDNGWGLTVDNKSEDSGFVVVVLMGGIPGNYMPPGNHTLFNILFGRSPCPESHYIHWDTTLSDDPTRYLLFCDTSFQELHPFVDPDRDSTEIASYQPGDFDDNCSVDVGDLTYLVAYLFQGGPAPCMLNAADVNGDCTFDVADLTYLVAFLFQGGSAPVCGCVNKGGVVPKVTSNISINSVFDNGITTISLNSGVALRGLQLKVKGTGDASPVNLLDERLELLFGEQDEGLRIGLLDLQGVAVIAAGTQRVIQLSGEYEVTGAIVSDMNHQAIAVSIGASKETTLPTEFALNQNYPNPFNPVTQISFILPNAAEVSLEIYNIMGQKVSTLVNDRLEAGEHVVVWDGSTVASGVYFYRLVADDMMATKKMVLLK